MKPEQLFVVAIEHLTALNVETVHKMYGITRLMSDTYICPRHSEAPNVAAYLPNMKVCMTCVLKNVRHSEKAVREPIKFKSILDSMKPVPRPVNTQNLAVNNYVGAVRNAINSKKTWPMDQVPKDLDIFVREQLASILDLSQMLKSEALSAFCAVANRYMKTYSPGSFLIDSGYTMKLLMLEPHIQNGYLQALCFHNDTKRHQNDIINIGKIFARPSQPGVFCFLHCENLHWVMFVVDTLKGIFYTYNSMRPYNEEPLFRTEICAHLSTAFKKWGYIKTDLVNVPIENNLMQEEEDLTNCALYVVTNALRIMFSDFDVQEVSLLRSILFCTLAFQQLPFL